MGRRRREGRVSTSSKGRGPCPRADAARPVPLRMACPRGQGPPPASVRVVEGRVVCGGRASGAPDAVLCPPTTCPPSPPERGYQSISADVLLAASPSLRLGVSAASPSQTRPPAPPTRPYAHDPRRAPDTSVPAAERPTTRAQPGREDQGTPARGRASPEEGRGSRPDTSASLNLRSPDAFCRARTLLLFS
ncbi:hypothetical protein NDU88_010763 [Pleurodeles waltl]|uniref:Uncharacterized protein n=1 Tax=Pleurodeles waltl TaxID=8319 RepID=A0AAV7S468_PLEWA|nr:hypothetical protein NDU88_010763 [Pleurodeles waltl]